MSCPITQPKPTSNCAKCVSDCKSVIDAAKQSIADRDKTISDLDSTITDLGTQLNTTQSDRDNAIKSRDAWYHNPFILIPLGIIVGGAGVLYLTK